MMSGPRRLPHTELAISVVEVLRGRCTGMSVLGPDPETLSAEGGPAGRTALVLTYPLGRKRSLELRGAVEDGRLLLVCTQELCHQVPVCIKGLRALDLPSQRTCPLPPDSD